MRTFAVFFVVVFAQIPLFAAPEKFLWGVANSAFQVEGSPLESDWLSWTHTEGKIHDATNADVATDFWNRSAEDIELARQLGARAFRLSIAWERVQPGPDQWDEKALLHYEKILVQIRNAGMEPIVTLHHFVLPLWLSKEGGLLAPDFSKRFQEYALKVVERFAQGAPKVRLWMTFNEPTILAAMGYLAGIWPPGLKYAPIKADRAMKNMVAAHIETVRSLRARWPQAGLRFSIAMHWRLLESATSSIADRVAARTADYFYNRRVMDPLVKSGTLDYIGLNYYGRTIASTSLKFPFYQSIPGSGPKTDLGWEIYPEGLYKALKLIGGYGLPILITENGLADAGDLQRGEFLKAHIAAMEKAISEGVKVMGYLHWSLTDNFEWADGLSPRFGLVEIDYATGRRTPRPSFGVYQSIIENAKARE